MKTCGNGRTFLVLTYIGLFVYFFFSFPKIHKEQKVFGVSGKESKAKVPSVYIERWQFLYLG